MSHPLRAVAVALFSTLSAPLAFAADAGALKKDVETTIVGAQKWLLAQQQPNGAFMKGDQFVLGVTELVVTALAKEPMKLGADNEQVKKALDFIVKYKQPDGGFYDPQEGLGDYGTSLALLVFTATGTGDKEAIVKAQNYLKGIQNKDEKDPARGGIGYGDDKPGDENINTVEFAVQALRASGVPANDPSLQAALKFLEHCQNLSSVNDMPWAKAGTSDGGAVYSPKESKAGGSWGSEEDKKAGEEQAKTGTLTSYGSMTYALISSYVALDLKPEDPRVAAALAWINDHYQFDANPGMRKGAERQGLFYYYLMMAKTLDRLGIKELELKDGKKVDWRDDLYKVIKAEAIDVTPSDNGIVMWRNTEKRWGEEQPHVATTYMLLALKHIHHSLE